MSDIQFQGGLSGKFILDHPFIIPLSVFSLCLGITFICLGIYLMGMKLGWWNL